jgi:hypothetical protein
MRQASTGALPTSRIGPAALDTHCDYLRAEVGRAGPWSTARCADPPILKRRIVKAVVSDGGIAAEEEDGRNELSR